MGARPRTPIAAASLAALVLSTRTMACDDTPIEAVMLRAPVSVRMDFARPDFFAAPFPSDDLAGGQPGTEGPIAIDRWPNPEGNPFIAQVSRLLRDARGFAVSAGAFVSLTGALDPASLPDVAASIQPASSVALVDLDAAAARAPIHVGFEADGGPYGAPNLLSVVPLQGISLAPRHRYALVVTRRVRDASGRPLEPSGEMRSILGGTRPKAMSESTFASYARALGELRSRGMPADDIAGLSVFTTGDPSAGLLAASAAVLARPLPTLAAPPTRGEIADGYCVYNATITLPDFQGGAPPFAKTGGEWVLDAAGKPVMQREAVARIVLTVPRKAAPAAGYPLAMMIRTGGGGDRPLVDRGVQGADGKALAPLSGPARELAAVGWAGASADGPHAGARNPTNGDEQFLMFNVENIGAIRDNVRQTALETALLEAVLASLSFDASDCPGASPVARFDANHVALVGHSMGATVAPLALAAQPKFGAAILGGAGASWIENLLHKKKPLAVRPIVELLLGYQNQERTLRRGDPALSLLQWALEPADPLVYDPLLADRHLFVQQGIVDHYIMPTIANAMALSMGLDLAGDALDERTPELARDPEQTPLGAVLAFAKRSRVPLPAVGNRGGVTAVVRQYAEDGVEDGHEVMFQTALPKAEARCFLASWASGRGPAVTETCAAP